MREIAIMLQRKKKRRAGDIVVMNLYLMKIEFYEMGRDSIYN